MLMPWLFQPFSLAEINWIDITQCQGAYGEKTLSYSVEGSIMGMKFWQAIWKIHMPWGKEGSVPQLWSPCATTTEAKFLEPVLHNKRGQHSEKPEHRNQRVAPTSRN